MNRTANGTALDVSRPRTSGPSVNVHVVSVQVFKGPNYTRMQEQINNPERVEKLNVEQSGKG